MINSPTLISKVGSDHILWFKSSNKYIIVNSNVFNLISEFVNSNSKKEFKNKIENHNNTTSSADAIYSDIKLLLKDCNLVVEKKSEPNIRFKPGNRHLRVAYLIDDIILQVFYGNADLKSFIHPQIAHLVTTCDDSNYRTSVFDIYSENDSIYFFKDKKLVNSYPFKEYHYLQGKFAMELLCTINQNQESDWMGTFHASTVKKGNKGIMLIGDSGSGKSTFTALMMTDKYDLVADDITPVLAKDKKIYPYPAGVSIKSGAFKALDAVVPNFSCLEEVYINPFKGYVKYIPSGNEKDITKGIDCNTLIYVSYKKGVKTSIEPFELNEALHILIPESWIEPSENNAMEFIEWLKQLKCYKLSYSNYKEAINEVEKLIAL